MAKPGSSEMTAAELEAMHYGLRAAASGIMARLDAVPPPTTTPPAPTRQDDDDRRSDARRRDVDTHKKVVADDDDVVRRGDLKSIIKDAIREAREEERKEREEEDDPDREESEELAADDDGKQQHDDDDDRHRRRDDRRTNRRARADKQLNDLNLIAELQQDWAKIAMAHGQRPVRPMDGERPLSFDRRCARMFQQFSEKWKRADLANCDSGVLAIASPEIRADALQAAYRPAQVVPGMLREIKTRDRAGREVSEFVGDVDTWLNQFSLPVQRARFDRDEIRETKRKLHDLDLKARLHAADRKAP